MLDSPVHGSPTPPSGITPPTRGEMMVGAAMVVPDGVGGGVLDMLMMCNENVAVAACKV